MINGITLIMVGCDKKKIYKKNDRTSGYASDSWTTCREPLLYRILFTNESTLNRVFKANLLNEEPFFRWGGGGGWGETNTVDLVMFLLKMIQYSVFMIL